MVVVFIIYLVMGLLLLGIFDLLTGRIRRNWDKTVLQFMGDSAQQGLSLNAKQYKAVFLTILWLFWPGVFIVAINEKVPFIDVITRGVERIIAILRLRTPVVACRQKYEELRRRYGKTK